MSSINRFPFEVTQKIAFQLDRKDKLSCLTVCSAIYPAILDSLYRNVVIEDMVTFRYFLSSIAHHRHQPNYSVKTLSFHMNEMYSQFETRVMTFTEFELLARYCVNLTELYFLEIGYWRFMKELDFTKQWLRLIKIPELIGSNDDFEVYQKLKDRLIDVSYRKIFEPRFHIMDLVNYSQHVTKLSIDDRKAMINIRNLQQIHECYSELKELVLYTKISEVEFDDIKLNTASLQSLSCTVDRPNSPWFSLFETWYTDVDSLQLRCNLEGNNTRSISYFDMVGSILDILHSSNIQQLQFTFSNCEQFDFLAKHAITETVYDDIICNKTPTISLDFSYAEVDDNNTKESNKLQCSLSKKNSLREFEMRYNLDYREDFSETKFLEKLIQSPIKYQLTHLSLTRIITVGTHPNAYKIPRPLYLDSALNHFPNLQSFTFTLHKQKQYTTSKNTPKYKNENSLAIVTLANTKVSSIHNQLRYLHIVSTTIDPSVYQYLFRKCPFLSSITLQNVRIKDDETLLALEYLCLENNVELIMIE